MKKQPDDFRNLAAERAVLAGICKYGGDAFVDVDDLIDADTFRAQHINSLIYKCLERNLKNDLGRKVDIPSIISAAKSLGFEADINGPDGLRYLRSIFRYPIERETVRREAQTLFKESLKEQLDEVVSRIRRDLRTIPSDVSFNEILSTVENPVFEFVSRINQSEEEGPAQIALGIDELLDSVESNPRDNIGISSGFARYDYYIGGGYRRATVSVLGARMKVGKTVFCDNVALHVAGELGIPVLNLDTEMTRGEHQARILSHVCGTKFGVVVTIREIETGKYVTDETKRATVRKAAEWLKTIPYEYDSVIDKSFEEQVSIMRRWVRRRVGVDETGRTKDCLVIYDYLQPPEPGEFDGDFKEYQLLGYQMLSLLRVASRCDVPVFTLVQLNRDGISKENTSVAADSDRVLRKGANFTILKWKSETEIAQDGQDEGTHKLVVVIARHGEAMVSGDYINIRFDGYTARMIERKTRNELFREKKSVPKGFQVEVEEESETEF